MFFLSILFLLANAQAPYVPNRSDVEMLTQQGSLFSVKIVRGEPIRIYVFGREEAQLDFSNQYYQVGFDTSDFSLQVRRIGSKSSKILKIKRMEDHYIILNPQEEQSVYHLEITPQIKDKKEVFKFKINNRLK